jgi:hypothetical protein
MAGSPRRSQTQQAVAQPSAGLICSVDVGFKSAQAAKVNVIAAITKADAIIRAKFVRLTPISGRALPSTCESQVAYLSSPSACPRKNKTKT